jgi:hypothetical protein
MISLPRFNAVQPERKDPAFTDVGQTLRQPPPRDPTSGITVSELSELEARALCAREDIPVFWPRPNNDKRAA